MTRLSKEENIHGNRKYKDSLFRLVFKEKEDLLTLYNAMNGTDYQDVTTLEVSTLENVLYMGVKNDVSFLIGCTMNLYEHQSSQNANMPLRGLIYFSKMYENYISKRKLNIYTKKLQKLPTPQYIVFYNGTENEPDEKVMKLSDAFIKENGCIECTTRMLNINYGHNLALMEKCRRLEEYSIFVDRVRFYKKENIYALDEAIEKAIDECIQKGVLVNILTEQRNEVRSMILSTFDKELYEKDLKEEAYEEGYNAKLYSLISKKLAKGKTIKVIAEELEETVEVIEKAVENMN